MISGVNLEVCRDEMGFMNGRSVCYLQSKGSAAVEQVAPDNAAFALQGASIAERFSLDRTSGFDKAKLERACRSTSRLRRRRRYATVPSLRSALLNSMR